jgi:hypothetical protein
VALVRNGVTEERIASMIRVTRIGTLRKTLAVIINRRMLRRNTSNIPPSSPILVTLMMEAIRSFETSVGATQHDISEENILQF